MSCTCFKNSWNIIPKNYLLFIWSLNLTVCLVFLLAVSGSYGEDKKWGKLAGDQKIVFAYQRLYFDIKHKSTLWASWDHFLGIGTAKFIPTKLVKKVSGRDFDFAWILVLLSRMCKSFNTSSISSNLKSVAMMWGEQVCYQAISCWQLLNSVAVFEAPSFEM